ncbi:LacI family DNA-binding transcriptional regulator [Angelakisella massiliensis]|uniref:LacI family DNA-binding transcriptional regulator n=1 Tax=Angelakisella massiliensis TaxID=1871018 RepID=UPI0008F945A9|nr:LacI family DNA-binding transcriptional regulator [Angelakisella massiliensis]
MKNGVRMSDIARALGVSSVTVSKALADKEGVGEELRAKIKATAEQMGYSYVPTIGKLAADCTGTVGAVIAQRYTKPEHSFYWSMSQNVIQSLKKARHLGLIEIVREEEESAGILPPFANTGRVDGIIVLGTMSTAYLKKLHQTGLSLVLVDFYNDEVPASAVTADSFLNSFRISSYLYQMGHREIGFVGSLWANSGIQDRFFGYCKALLVHGLPYYEDWILEDREDDNFRQTFQLPEHLPTAFVCNCDQTAYHFIRYLQSQGYRVPEDISVVGFYDYIFATMCDPQLTTIYVDLAAMAEEAVSAVFRLRNGPGQAETITVKGKLVCRDSVRRLEPM